ncbi:MAG: hypothetical protein QOF01_5073 [Thermomicrobiales bacterium]|nr:hypothetical protein [Thermomicrobiales bacterium]
MLPSRRMHAVRVFVLIVLGLSIVLPVAPVATAETTLTAPDPGPGDTNPALYQPVLPGEREDAYAATAGRLTRYRIEATLTPGGDQPATIAGTLDLNYYNGTGQAQEALYLRLYPNDDEYAEGGQTLDSVTVDGVRIEPELSEADTVAAIPLPEAVAPEATVEVQVAFTTTIPSDPRESYGMFGVDSETGTYALAHWEPLLAGYDPVDGWNLDLLSNYGDPVFTDTALYDVTLTAPEDLIVVTTGSETESEAVADGQLRHRILSGPVRDFVMVLDGDLQSVSEEVGGTTVRSWYNPGDVEIGQDILRYGAQSLEVFGGLFGAYPYTEMDLLPVDLSGAAGVEFPQIMYIEDSYYDPGNASSRRDPDSLEFTVAHEVAHQWWYGMVGNNQYEHAFIDEGLTNFVTTIYFREMYGDEKADEQVDRNLKLWYLTMLFGAGEDQVVDQPTDDFPSQGHYGSTIYGKAALGFGAIDDAIGDDAFFAALTDYAAEFRFNVATPADLRAAFERASGQDLGELWRHWFEATEGEHDFNAAEYARLRREYGR